MKVLMIYEAKVREPGGLQIHVLALKKTLKRYGHYVIEYPVTPLFRARQSLPLKGLSMTKNASTILIHLVGLLNLLRRSSETPDLIHVHGPREPLILGFILSRITRKPLVITMHEARSQSTRYNPLWKRADKIIVISKEIKSVLINYGVDKEKVVYIPNMIIKELPENLPVAEKDTVLFMGRLHPEKIGILKILLDATPRILNTRPDAKILIAGPDGSSAAEIKTLASKLNQRYGRSVVKLLGYVTNPEYHIAKASVVIGVSRVALESMIQGKPTIVGTTLNDRYFSGALVDGDNIEELETENFTGVNFHHSIDSKELSETIIGILRGDVDLKKTIECPRDYVISKFENSVIVKRIIYTYSECIHSQKRKKYKNN